MYKPEDQVASSESLPDQVKQKSGGEVHASVGRKRNRTAESIFWGTEWTLKKSGKKKQEKNYLKEEIADMLEEDVSTIENIMSELQE